MPASAGNCCRRTRQRYDRINQLTKRNSAFLRRKRRGLAKLDTLIDALDEKYPERNDGRKGKISDRVCDRTQWYLTCIEDIISTWEEDEEVPARFYASLCLWGGSALLEIDFLKTELGAKETIINGYDPFTGYSFEIVGKCLNRVD